MVTPSSEPHKNNRLRVYLSGVLIFIVLFMVVWQAYLLFVPHARISFALYTPKGYAIHDAHETLYGNKLLPGVNNFIKPKVSVRYTIQSSRLDVYQEKAANGALKCSTYIEQTCTVYTTPSGQKYLLTTTLDGGIKDSQGQPKVDQSVELLKGNTRIYITSQGSLNWGPKEWGKLVASLQVTKISPLPVVWEHPGP